MQNPFVFTEWLAERLGAPNIVVVDASWFLPSANRKPHDEYLSGHIPGAVFFDIDGIADKATTLPHMLLGPEEFARQVGALGIGDGNAIELDTFNDRRMPPPAFDEKVKITLSGSDVLVLGD